STRTGPSVDGVFGEISLDAVGVTAGDSNDDRVFANRIGVIFVGQKQGFADDCGHLTGTRDSVRLGTEQVIVVTAQDGRIFARAVVDRGVASVFERLRHGLIDQLGQRFAAVGIGTIGIEEDVRAFDVRVANAVEVDG